MVLSPELELHVNLLRRQLTLDVALELVRMCALVLEPNYLLASLLSDHAIEIAKVILVIIKTEAKRIRIELLVLIHVENCTL